MNSFHHLADLTGRHALVTGGAGHIGQVAAETLAELGASVTISDLASSNGDEIAARIGNETGRRVEFVPADLRSETEIEMLVRQIADEYGSLNILIQAAALVGTSDLAGWAVPFEHQSTETWNLAMKVNLSAAFTLTKTAAPLMRESGTGAIVLMSSIYGFLGPDPSLYDGTEMGSPAAYFASKGGLEQLCKWLASTLAPHVRVNTICPGGIARGQDRRFVERYSAKTPLGRLATEDDLRGAIGYLCSDLSAYVTGHRLTVDGGLSVR